MRAIAVHEPSQVAEARRAAVSLAQGHGFDEENAGRVAIVATELATNLIKHGGGGALLVGSYDDTTGAGIECLALDRGEGIADMSASMRDGHSTSGSPGTGLGAILRGAQVTDFYSVPGSGTAILARLTPGKPNPSRTQAWPAYGAVAVPMAGEEACGDSWCHKPWNGERWMAMVADGLGHGPYAAEASHLAASIFAQDGSDVPSGMLAAMHGALRPTRGAAVAIARIDPDQNEVLFAGVGNVAAVIVDNDQGLRRMVSNNGTIGHIAKHMRDFSYGINAAALLVMASDGLATSWRLDAYPGLATHHPTLIAGVLYRDFSRGRDDVTVLVCRMAPP